MIVVLYTNFFFFRRGWNTPEIQYHSIFWMVRLLFTPLVVFFTIKSWRELNQIASLLLTWMAGFCFYTLAYWAVSFLFCRLVTRNFDNRNLNLFNTIKNDSFLLNLLNYIISVFIIYIWIYFEHTDKIVKKNLQLKKSLVKANLELLKDKQELKLTSGSAKLDKLTIKNGFKTLVIPMVEIVCFLSHGPYVKVLTEKGTYMLNSPLYKLQATLPQVFLRVHRSHIVNIEFIKEAKSLLNGDYSLLLKNGTEIRVSRTYRENLRAVLGRI